MEGRGNYWYNWPRYLLHRGKCTEVTARLRGANPTLGAREVRIKSMAQRLIVSVAAVAALVGGVVVATEAPAAAASTYCKTLHLSGNWQDFAIRPWMDVPICYNGSSVWQSGNVTAGVATSGYSASGTYWAGTYGGGGWLGAGENFTATAWGSWFSFYCAPRWGINAWGNVISYSRNCYNS